MNYGKDMPVLLNPQLMNQGFSTPQGTFPPMYPPMFPPPMYPGMMGPYGPQPYNPYLNPIVMTPQHLKDTEELIR